MYTTLIDSTTLNSQLDNPQWLAVDCRFNLTAPSEGYNAYLESHISGAVFADLDKVLSHPPATDHGRHPLPAPEVIEARFSRLGINPGTQVVAYDAGPGVIASRLWWMLHYMGHRAVAVLDGGITHWREAGLSECAGEEIRSPAEFIGKPDRSWLTTLEQVAQARLLIDAREPPRFRGEVEPLDRVPGHIPGAVNRFFAENLNEQGRFLSPEVLREQFTALLGGIPSEVASFYCGSGVSACHNLLALVHAGLAPGSLYVGSWSEWSADPERPVATGA